MMELINLVESLLNDEENVQEMCYSLCLCC